MAKVLRQTLPRCALQATLAVVMLILLMAGPALINAGREIVRFLPACPLYKFLGIPCPTCGATRAMMALGNGEIADALQYNPMMVLLYFTLVGGAIALLVAALAGKPVSLGWNEKQTAKLRCFCWTILGSNWIYVMVRELAS